MFSGDAETDHSPGTITRQKTPTNKRDSIASRFVLGIVMDATLVTRVSPEVSGLEPVVLKAAPDASFWAPKPIPEMASPAATLRPPGTKLF